jgi:hypothetical protein
LLNCISDQDIAALSEKIERPIEVLKWRQIQLQQQTTAKCKNSWWTESDTQELVASVIKHGTYNWKQIAYTTGRHTSLECFHHWHTKANPIYKKRIPWSVEEDAKLIQLVKIYTNNWEKIAEHMIGRTDLQCRERYCNVLDSKIRHKQWTEEEDDELLQYCCHENYKGKWSLIASSMKNRTDNQCWRRWRKIHQNLEKKVCCFINEELIKMRGLDVKKKIRKPRAKKRSIN